MARSLGSSRTSKPTPTTSPRRSWAGHSPPCGYLGLSGAVGARPSPSFPGTCGGYRAAGQADA
eukprot:2878907-Alexandrium_andersonii.AAC.1